MAIQIMAAETAAARNEAPSACFNTWRQTEAIQRTIRGKAKDVWTFYISSCELFAYFSFFILFVWLGIVILFFVGFWLEISVFLLIVG